MSLSFAHLLVIQSPSVQPSLLRTYCILRVYGVNDAVSSLFEPYPRSRLL